jgi:hypothetical protein
VANGGSTGTGGLSALLNTTAAGASVASFAAQTTFDTGPNPYAVVASDVNRDGRPDALVTDGTAELLSVLLNTTAAPLAAPGSVSFGTQPLEALSPPQTVTVTNWAPKPIGVSAALTGQPDDLLITSNGCASSVPANGSCEIHVRFAPSAAGDRAATLTVTGASWQPPLTVALTGTGGSLPQGPAGAQGQTGPQGPQGPAGKVE